MTFAYYTQPCFVCFLCVPSSNPWPRQDVACASGPFKSEFETSHLPTLSITTRLCRTCAPPLAVRPRTHPSGCTGRIIPQQTRGGSLTHYVPIMLASYSPLSLSTPHFHKTHASRRRRTHAQPAALAMGNSNTRLGIINRPPVYAILALVQPKGPAPPLPHEVELPKLIFLQYMRHSITQRLPGTGRERTTVLPHAYFRYVPC